MHQCSLSHGVSPFFERPPHRLVGDRGHDTSDDQPIRQQLHRPDRALIGRRRAGQRDQVGLASCIQSPASAWARFLRQRPVEPALNEAAPDPLDGAHRAPHRCRRFVVQAVLIGRQQHTRARQSSRRRPALAQRRQQLLPLLHGQIHSVSLRAHRFLHRPQAVSGTTYHNYDISGGGPLVQCTAMTSDRLVLDGLGIDTRLVHLGRDESDPTGALVPPIHLAAAFARGSLDEQPAFAYSRRGNPTRTALENTLAALHGASRAFAFGSGMGAVTGVAMLLEAGARVILPDDVYSNTHRLFTALLQVNKINPIFIDLTDLSHLDRALREPAAMIWLESPTNPSMKVLDIAAIAGRARSAGIPVAVDNSYASPYFQKPLALGATIVIESTTKYLNGHDDIMGGAVMTSDTELAERLALIQYVGGAVPSPFDCWLLLRGIKTLALRMERHQENALAVAEFLSQHPAVRAVRYPGLPSDPGHEIAKRQMTGFSGMVTFELAGDPDEARRVVGATRLFQLAGGLGGVESLISYPALGSGASQAGTAMAPSLAMVRLSVGIESKRDLIDDLAQALQR